MWKKDPFICFLFAGNDDFSLATNKLPSNAFSFFLYFAPVKFFIRQLGVCVCLWIVNWTKDRMGEINRKLYNNPTTSATYNIDRKERKNAVIENQSRSKLMLLFLMDLWGKL